MVAPSSTPHSRTLYVYFAILGFGLILPWNLLLNSISVFSDRFPRNSNYNFFCPLLFNSPQLFVQLFQLAFGGRFSATTMLILGYTLLLCGMVATPLLLPVGLYAVLATNFVCGAATAVLESSLFSACAKFPSDMAGLTVRAVFVGEGAAGLLANLIQLALYAEPPSSDAELLDLVRGYFVFGAVVMAGCAVLVPYALALGAASPPEGEEDSEIASLLLSREKSMASKKGMRWKEREGEDEEEGEGGEEGDGGWGKGLVPVTEAALVAKKTASSSSPTKGGGVRTFLLSPDPLGQSEGTSDISSSGSGEEDFFKGGGVLTTLIACWPTCLSIFLAMFLSFLVFPGAVSSAAYVGSPKDYFYRNQTAWTLLLFLVFSLGDLGGRSLAGVLSCGCSPRAPTPAATRAAAWVVLGYNLARAALIPLFFLLAKLRGGVTAAGGKATFSNLAILALCTIHSITNGHAATFAMMLGPQLVGMQHRGVASTLHVLSLISGLWAGSAGGFLFVEA